MRRSVRRRRAGRTQLDLLVDRIGWSHNQVAAYVGVSTTTWMRWVDGSHPSPPEILRWMERIARAIERIGPPPPVPRYSRRGVPIAYALDANGDGHGLDPADDGDGGVLNGAGKIAPERPASSTPTGILDARSSTTD